LAWDDIGSLHLEAYDSLPLEENHRLGIEHWNAERFFPAHEAWETCWKQAKQTKDAEFFKGLSQLGAGYVHLLRGNLHGAKTLLRRGSGRIRRYEEGHRGIPVKALAETTAAHAEEIEEAERKGDPAPALDFPKI
jgi:predicted metal-dependent hydrolase